jgi:vacuolar-type H+-ATPase subunit I/STV1
MEKQLFKNVSPTERIQMLKDNAERTEEFQYPRELTPDEISELKDELSSESITLSKLEEKKKEAMNEFKAEIKPVKAEVQRILQLLRTRSEEVEEKVYLLADLEEGMMGYYNSKGELVHSRLLRQNEKQYRIQGEGVRKLN